MKTIDIIALLLAIMPYIKQVESSNGLYPIGDGGRAHGSFQVHKICVDDVNRVYKTEYTHQDMFDDDKAEAVFLYYLSYGVILFEEKHGRPPTEEEVVRMWNGGIYKGYTYNDTNKYYENYVRAKRSPVRTIITDSRMDIFTKHGIRTEEAYKEASIQNLALIFKEEEKVIYHGFIFTPDSIVDARISDYYTEISEVDAGIIKHMGVKDGVEFIKYKRAQVRDTLLERRVKAISKRLRDGGYAYPSKKRAMRDKYKEELERTRQYIRWYEATKINT